MIDLAHAILDEVRDLVGQARPAELERLHELVRSAPRVFAFATGRSGFVLRGFVMRLNHLGQPAFYVGDASTPPVRPGDLLLCMSGSGTTATTLGAAMEAAKIGATVAAVVGARISPLGQLAQAVVELPAPHKRGVSVPGAVATRQTAGSLFEQAAFVLLETIIMRRFQELGQDPVEALRRHANIEA